MNNLPYRRAITWVVGISLLAIMGYAGWLIQSGRLVFESDIIALLPTSEDSKWVDIMDARVSAAIKNRLAIVVQHPNQTQVDIATDRLIELIERAIDEKSIRGKLVSGLEMSELSLRIDAMLAYKDRLIGHQSRQRLQASHQAQLMFRMDNVTQFPPANFTDPLADPLGTLEDFLLERMLRASNNVSFDGLYLRIASDPAANLLVVELTDGELGNTQASHSTQQIMAIRDAVAAQLDVKIYLAGVPFHASEVKRQTVQEIFWMGPLALILTLAIFFYMTRAIRALLISAAALVVAVAGGLVISYSTLGLPHLIGLTMATSAVGICIDFSLHFWVHVSAGMRGASALRAIRAGVNMSFLTTLMGMLVISAVSIPALAQTAVFIIGTLLVSWMLVLFIMPSLVGNKRGTIRANSPAYLKLPKRIAVPLMWLVMGVSVTGLALKYYTDDDPIRLGRIAPELAQQNAIVNKLLAADKPSAIYLVQSDSPAALLELEAKLLQPLSVDELTKLEAISRLVIPQQQQQRNRLLFQQAKDNIDAELLEQYLSALNVPALDWGSNTSEAYALLWVLAQPWAALERRYILDCTESFCASMLRAYGEIVNKLDRSCQNHPECSRISFKQRQLDGFAKLRANLAWSLLLALIGMFIILLLRYRRKAFGIISVPILAALSGFAVIAWAGMPVTAFTLAAIFPLIGLSVDYAIFASESASESGSHSEYTYRAIFASALTTFLSFSILAFSGTPAIQFFALPVAVGILVAWISTQVLRIAQK